MPADHVFRRTRSIQHTMARAQRHQPKQSRAPHSQTLRLLVVVGCLGLLLGVVVVLWQSQRLPELPTVRHIDCRLLDGTDCPAPVSTQLQPLIGQPLLFTALESDLQQLTTPIGIKVVKYERVIPETIRVVIAPLDVLFYLEDQEKTVAVTSAGSKLSLPVEQQAQLITLHVVDSSLSNQLEVSTEVPTWLLGLIKDLYAFFSQEDQLLEQATLRSPFELELKLLNQSHPVLLNPQESALNLGRLSFILKSGQYTELATPSAMLDVRFRLPVLRR